MSEEFILANIEWIFKVDRDLGLECIKKFNRNDPFKSDKVLRYIKEQGGPKACLKYLEYLTLECGVLDRPIHTELACLYVQYIISILHEYVIVERNQ